MATRAIIGPAAAVAYIRMSSDMQDASPDQQREQVQRLADRLGSHIVRWYEDLAVSGDDLKRRKGFRRMLSDAKELADFSQILCWSQDRFGRFDSLEAGEHVGPLRRAGIKLITVAEGEINWSDSSGRLVYSIRQESKNEYLRELARNVCRGKQARARRPGCYVGRTAYGYERQAFDERGKVQRRIARQDKFTTPKGWSVRLVLSRDKAEHAVVRKIFREYALGRSTRQIAGDLNRRRIPSARGLTWSTMAIRGMLRNPVYVGDQVWNRHHAGRYYGISGGNILSDAEITGSRHRTAVITPNPKADWVVLRNAHPALVSRRLFDQIQPRLQRRQGRPYQFGGLALSRMVYCGHCGSRMYAGPFRKGFDGAIYHYRKFICVKSRHYGLAVCRPWRIDEPRLLKWVVDTLLNRVLDEGFAERLRDQLTFRMRCHCRDNKNSAALSRRLDSVEADLSRGIDNMLRAKPHQVELAVKRLSQWQSMRDALREKLDAAERATPAAIERSVAKAVTSIRHLRFGLKSEDPRLLHQALQNLVERVTVWYEFTPDRRFNCPFARGELVVNVPGSEVEVYQFAADELPTSIPTVDQGWRKERQEPASQIVARARQQRPTDPTPFDTTEMNALCRRKAAPMNLV